MGRASTLGGVRWTGYAYCAYAASKGAVNSFTQSVALQYAAKGIRANCILPGLMDTPHIYKQISGFYANREEMVAARNRMSPTDRIHPNAGGAGQTRWTTRDLAGITWIR